MRGVNGHCYMPGYPAWAGIDPHGVAVGASPEGLPRVGGDRPASGGSQTQHR